MKRTIKTLLAVCVSLCLGTIAMANDPNDNWTNLFNGKDLSGWKKLNGNASYHIEGDVIVGTSTMNTPNTFLATEKTYGDFILELEIHVDPLLNAGVQIRSESKESYNKGRVHGYQVEIDPSTRAWSGGIYDEARRGWLYPLSSNPKGRKAFRNNEWNHYRVEAIGNSIRTWINGIPCADLIDDMTAEGFIALQVHGIGKDEKKNGTQVKYKNIRIQTENLVRSPWTNIPVINLVSNYLSPQERAQGWQLLFDGKSTDGWRGAHMKAFPEKGWKINGGELIVESSGGAESQHGGDIVTEEEYSMFELSLDFMITEGANSGIKYFITEQYLTDNPRGGSAIGLEFQILDDKKHPDAKKGADGNRTIASLYDMIPAHETKTVKKPGQWNNARLVVKGVRRDEWQQRRGPMVTDFKGAYVEHWLNHKKVLEYERGTQAFGALVARSKYAKWEGFGNWEKGRILLQDHGDEVHFKNIKIRRLE